MTMVVLGAVILRAGITASILGWILASVYLLYGIGGALWIMIFLCPYCHFWNTTACPCGYGRIAARLREKKLQEGTDDNLFRKKFRRHIPVIVPLWFIPVVVGVVCIRSSFSWLLLVLLVVFAVDAFVVLPVLSRKHGCVECPQKDLCPWMGDESSDQ
jgi:hypothetical protein